MTTTGVKTRKTEPLFQDGRRGGYCHSLATNCWMEVKASFSLGTKNTERSTKKRCCITLIQARKERSLNINRNQGNRKAFNWHRQHAREPPRGDIILRMNKKEEKALETGTLPILHKKDMASLIVPHTVLTKPVSRAFPIIPRTLNQEKSEEIIEETTAYLVIVAVLNKACQSLILSVMYYKEKAAYPVIPEMLTKEEMAPLQATSVTTHPGLIKHLFTTNKGPCLRRLKVRKMCIIYNCYFKRKLDYDIYALVYVLSYLIFSFPKLICSLVELRTIFALQLLCSENIPACLIFYWS